MSAARSASVPSAFLHKFIEMNDTSKKTSGSQQATKADKKGKSVVGKRKRETGAFVKSDKKEAERRRQSGFFVSF